MVSSQVQSVLLQNQLSADLSARRGLLLNPAYSGFNEQDLTRSLGIAFSNEGSNFLNNLGGGIGLNGMGLVGLGGQRDNQMLGASQNIFEAGLALAGPSSLAATLNQKAQQAFVQQQQAQQLAQLQQMNASFGMMASPMTVSQPMDFNSQILSRLGTTASISGNSGFGSPLFNSSAFSPDFGGLTSMGPMNMGQTGLGPGVLNSSLNPSDFIGPMLNLSPQSFGNRQVMLPTFQQPSPARQAPTFGSEEPFGGVANPGRRKMKPRKLQKAFFQLLNREFGGLLTQNKASKTGQ